MVRNELNFIEDSDIVYKLIGPILVKQEHSESIMTVDKRIEFIKKEM
jgi:prefoldin beta subunit